MSSGEPQVINDILSGRETSGNGGFDPLCAQHRTLSNIEPFAFPRVSVEAPGAYFRRRRARQFSLRLKLLPRSTSRSTACKSVRTNEHSSAGRANRLPQGARHCLTGQRICQWARCQTSTLGDCALSAALLRSRGIAITRRTSSATDPAPSRPEPGASRFDSASRNAEFVGDLLLSQPTMTRSKPTNKIALSGNRLAPWGN
jgi:hypothetical protein